MARRAGGGLSIGPRSGDAFRLLACGSQRRGSLEWRRLPSARLRLAERSGDAFRLLACGSQSEVETPSVCSPAARRAKWRRLPSARLRLAERSGDAFRLLACGSQSEVETPSVCSPAARRAKWRRLPSARLRLAERSGDAFRLLACGSQSEVETSARLRLAERSGDFRLLACGSQSEVETSARLRLAERSGDFRLLACGSQPPSPKGKERGRWPEGPEGTLYIRNAWVYRSPWGPNPARAGSVVTYLDRSTDQGETRIQDPGSGSDLPALARLLLRRCEGAKSGDRCYITLLGCFREGTSSPKPEVERGRIGSDEGVRGAVVIEDQSFVVMDFPGGW